MDLKWMVEDNVDHVDIHIDHGIDGCMNDHIVDHIRRFQVEGLGQAAAHKTVR